MKETSDKQLMSMKIARILMIFVFSIEAFAQSTTPAANCFDLTSVGTETKAYAKRLRQKVLRVNGSRAKIQILLTAVHSGDPIDRNKPSLSVVSQIAERFENGVVHTPGELEPNLKGFGSAWKTYAPLYQEIHNRFGRYGVSRVFFGPTAEDVFRLRMAFGCSHYARALKALLIASKTLSPGDVKYVAAVSVGDRAKICPATDVEQMADGHQFLKVRLEDGWFFLNASAEKIELAPALEDSTSLDKTISFPSLASRPFKGEVAVRAIDDGAHPMCDGSLEELRNVYRSGKPDSSVCRF